MDRAYPDIFVEAERSSERVYGWTALDRVMGTSTSIRQSLMKAVVNQIVLSPPYLATLLAFPQIQRGASSEHIKSTVQNKFLDLYIPAWCIWPAVNAFTFSQVPPGWKRLAFSNVVGVAWVGWVSYLHAKPHSSTLEDGQLIIKNVQSSSEALLSSRKALI
ncbi:hypothetical protein SmJEL517_g00688 [Synchytrium microbalum]|uniref:Mpv17/PMP22 family protein n=1 Tax=Synchytrium microbalum TaxID=1806994 RepID=A0A507CDM2_9FUNG|nr:uncharacterized protein SmJEL517_g00688 [Synchytrium microbalum]TPX37438.1 hypothetical protein SmJEL517_g00688 [Synchytrium microbalum]